MAFVTKTWKDRLVEYAGRRKLKNVATGEEVLMDVSRSEGTVSQAGDAFSAANMNNLEQRIKNEFDTVNSSFGGLKFGKDGDGNCGYYGADGSLIPFKSFKRFYAANVYARTTETEYKVGFKPKFFMLGYTDVNSVFWYDETLNKAFYNGYINIPTNIGSWIIPDGVNALCCITEINDTGFKAICNINHTAFVIAFG